MLRTYIIKAREDAQKRLERFQRSCDNMSAPGTHIDPFKQIPFPSQCPSPLSPQTPKSAKRITSSGNSLNKLKSGDFEKTSPVRGLSVKSSSSRSLGQSCHASLRSLNVKVSSLRSIEKVTTPARATEKQYVNGGSKGTKTPTNFTEKKPKSGKKAYSEHRVEDKPVNIGKKTLSERSFKPGEDIVVTVRPDKQPSIEKTVLTSRQQHIVEMFQQLLTPVDGDEKSEEKTTTSERDWSGLEGCFTKDLLPTNDDPTKTMQFLAEIVLILLDYSKKQVDRTSKVLDFHHPHQLREILDHCIGVDENPRDLEQVLSDCKETLKYCVKSGHPRFFNQLSSGQDIVGLAGEWVVASASSNMFTYEIAPVFTLMEGIILDRMRRFVGWEEGDGIFTPGGAIANLNACLCARHSANPTVKTTGVSGLANFVIFTSEQSHFSIKRAGAIMGIGTDHVINIKCDVNGKMIPSELDRCVTESLERGELPFMVSATGGTTVLGAFDPINGIADVCETHGLWLHVDCAWGGGVLMSKKHRYLLDGLHRADSVTWNPHKLMGVPLQCAAILLKDTGTLKHVNSMYATYLFQQDKNYDVSYDTGDKTIQCGRHNDIFKLWLMWRAKGDRGFEEHVDKVMALAEYTREQLKARDGFEFVLEKGELTNICFWYVPVRLRGLPQDDDWRSELNPIAPQIKASMMEAGTTLIGYQPLGELPNFFRWVISSNAVITDDIDFVINEIDKYGRDL